MAQALDLSGLDVAVASGAESGEIAAQQQAVRSSIIVWLDRQDAEPFEVSENVALFEDPVAGSLTRAEGHDLLIIATVEGDDDELTTILRLYDVEAETLLAVAESTDEVGLTFDRAVGQLTETLLRSAESTIAALVEREPIDADGTPEPGGTTEPNESPETRNPAADQRRSDPTPAPRPLPGAQSEPVISRASSPLLAFRLGISPQAPVYESATYLGFSWGASLQAALFPGRNGLWAVGLAGRVILSQASGSAASANVLTAPFGVTAELSPRLEPLAPVLRLTAGAAYMRATNEQLGAFTSIVPYASLDLASLVSLTDLINIEVGLGIEVLVERTIALIGLYPSISVLIDL